MDDLSDYLGTITQRPVHGQIVAFATALAQSHPGAVAVLAYGSALRDSSPAETLIDYYVLVDEPAHLTGNALIRFLGDRIPPNVHYAERDFDGVTLRSKYAVITAARFARLASADTRNPYIWARFAQPSRIVWTTSELARGDVIESLSTAVRTAYRHGLNLSPQQPWQGLFENTYRTELRPEDRSRAALIVAADAEYYADLGRLLAGNAPLVSSWRAKRVLGKLWSVARLAKAAFTFQGGADYAAWKIERHAGVKITVTPWQRRHPFLAGVLLLPKLLRRKGLK